MLNFKNVKIMNNNILEIIAPEGYVVEQVSEGKVTFKKVESVKLPKKWEDLVKINGWYASSNEVEKFEDNGIEGASADVFARKEQAQAVIALAKLSQLREVYRGGWEPDWTNNQSKYCMYKYEGELNKDTYASTNHFLSFQSEKVRDQFLENFRDLIEEASPLLFG